MRIWTFVFLAGAVFGSEPRRSSLAAEAGPPYEVKEPGRQRYFLEAEPQLRLLSVRSSQAPPPWIEARRGHPEGPRIRISARIVLQTEGALDLARLAVDHLPVARRYGPDLAILAAPNPREALEIASHLATQPGVIASYPLFRRHVARHGAYASLPNDPYFPRQWHLENRETATGARKGIDINVRAAWPSSMGEGVVIAIADDGVEYTHPDLAPRAAGMPHYNFVTGESNGLHLDTFQDHGTAVAGLAVASANNRRGVTGVAPHAQMASWVVFDLNDFLISEDQLSDMFQYRQDLIAIQNHSWGNSRVEQLRPGLIESRAISNAYRLGRGGLGTVFCRSAGNGRDNGNNVNDDGYASDPGAIAVGAIRSDGRVASYSTPGAAILIGMPSGDDDEGFSNLFTTDRQGSLGLNRDTSSADLADYAFEANGFSGTSASAPIASGLCALVLAANPRLHVRDVQLLLALSARQTDAADPDVKLNGAGLAVSHNAGYGVPDAGVAVRLAAAWRSAAEPMTLSLTATNLGAIPDDGLRVVLTGENVPENLRSIPATPMLGLHPDDATASLPLIDAGIATNTLSINLTNHAALIRRGISFFSNKLDYAARAGSPFAIIYNNNATNRAERIIMGGTEFSRIPGVMIDNASGEQLQQFLAEGGVASAQLRTESVQAEFMITNQLVTRHIGLRIRTDHQGRADLRIALRSPTGTWSIMQTRNSDRRSDLLDWTYYSTHHFLESSVGVWTVRVTDEWNEMKGSLLEASLIITGAPIRDTDQDGLDDDWEMANLETLTLGPRDDPDSDGDNNAREQVLGTNPRFVEREFLVDASAWSERLVRFSWPGRTNLSYEILGSGNLAGPFTVLTNLPGRFPETEWLTSRALAPARFFHLRSRERK